MELDWHARFTQQAQWTKTLRDYLLSQLEITPQWQILEIGCGTGAVLSDFQNYYTGKLYGIDIELNSCKMATRNVRNSSISNADALQLPFTACSFDLIFCHYFLLWSPAPSQALGEIKRTLKPGARLLVFAEPDYRARIDTPPHLERLAKLQTDSLIAQGANPSIGRQLPSLASSSGFKDIRYGVSGFETGGNQLPDWWDFEWLVLEHDLENLIDRAELDELRKIDQQCWLNGSRVLWVPTFYLSCTKPTD
jgi:ubiquinone/menaquinone biosynthesis C-methylase UbiE